MEQETTTGTIPSPEESNDILLKDLQIQLKTALLAQKNAEDAFAKAKSTILPKRTFSDIVSQGLMNPKCEAFINLSKLKTACDESKAVVSKLNNEINTLIKK